jgi:hypothetical protein
MIACMVHGALSSLFGFDIFPDEKISELIKTVADLFNLFIAKFPLAEVSFAFLNREHGNPLTHKAPVFRLLRVSLPLRGGSNLLSARLRIFLSSC